MSSDYGFADDTSRQDLIDFDAHWMGRAIELAQTAAIADEVPVGAVIVRDGKMIAGAANEREALHDPTAHAEMIAITQAAAAIENWRLEKATLYVTLEPCLMCAGAILQARVPRVVFGAVDPKAGAVASMYQVLNDDRLNHQCEVTSGVMAERCGRMLTEFFASKRAMGKK
ncbi:CMP/dCMP deaminase zinc-binding protein [Rhodopirellula sallentina SM41]|uniref:tRNA-specific adenosine deaminase n=2 Tax=Rhodopirellula TaxID=265488 RepID=M5U5L3_9BACT|nr:CMP/dCMP deaminase zinc-binding protein [Rhodopirellula sallentina SM41]